MIIYGNLLMKYKSGACMLRMIWNFYLMKNIGLNVTSFVMPYLLKEKII